MNRPDLLCLRLARARDADAIAAMSRRLIESGLAWRYTPSRVAALIADRDTLTVVAHGKALADQTGPGLHGFAVMHFGDTEAHLVLLAVEPAQQRRGTGRRLSEWLFASARVAGLSSVALELRADNEAARAFYGRLGFRETALAPDYYDGRVAARRMRLALHDAAG